MKMSRRTFLKTFAAGVAAFAVSPKILLPTSVTAGPYGWQVDAASKTIYLNPAPDQARMSVIELHRWLQDLADQPIQERDSYGQHLLNISSTNPSLRVTDNIISLENGWHIGDKEAQYLYDGSIIQDEGKTIYDGVVTFGEHSEIEIIQDGRPLEQHWWDCARNEDRDANVSHKFLVKSKVMGKDLGPVVGRGKDGVGFMKRCNEFELRQMFRGNNCMAL